MEVRVKLYALGTSPWDKESPVPTEENGWGPRPVWTFWRTGNLMLLLATDLQTSKTHSLVTTPTTLSWLYVCLS
jgi:hypothetical protein